MIVLASDHAGYALKEVIKEFLIEKNFSFLDIGTDSPESTDYPDWAHKASEKISSGECDRGILICGTGIGMSIVANKHKGIRAAVCESMTTARLARQHNDANVLAIGARVVGVEAAKEIVHVFLTTAFDGERHHRRVLKIHSITSV